MSTGGEEGRFEERLVRGIGGVRERPGEVLGAYLN